MSNATAVPNAIPVSDHGTYDGVEWFRTHVSDLSYETYRNLPNVVRFNGKTFVKMSFNTDNGTVSYKKSNIVAFA